MDYPLALSAHAQKGTTVMDYTINKLDGYGSAITVPIDDAYKDAPEATKAEETLRILDYLEASLTAPRW
jgi:hypothetical protein